MNRNRTVLFGRAKLTSALMLLLAAAQTPASAQLVTWVKPSGQKAAQIELTSLAEGVKLTLGDVGEPNTERREPNFYLHERGWKFENHPLGPMLRAGQGTNEQGEFFGRTSRMWGAGRKVAMNVSNLPPGKHTVFLRFWARAMGGDQKYYGLNASLEGREDQWWKLTDARIVNGLGGYEGAICEVELGTVGEEQRDATQVGFSFHRNKYVFATRFAGIRIETEPNPDIPRTSGQSLPEAEKQVRRQLLSFGPRSSDGETAYGFAAVPGSLKVRPKSFEDLIDVPLGRSFEISGAGGEYINRQLVVFSPKNDLPVKKLRVDALQHESGEAVIEAERVMFVPVGYQPFESPFDMERHGWWPEPILDFKTGGFTIRQGDAQALWLRVRVPRDAPAGQYEGQVTVAPKERPAVTVPVTLRVYDFDLPRAFHFRTLFGVGGSRFPEDFRLRYGINPSGLYGRTPPSKKDLQRWAKDGRINAFNIMHTRLPWMEGDGVPTEAQLEKMLEKLGQCLEAAEEVGLRDKAYFYIFDEAGNDAIPAMRMISEAVHERFPDLTMLTTSHVHGAHGNHDKLPHLDGWVPRIPKYDYEQAKRAREEFGLEVWWYTANSPRPPLPNTFVTQSAMTHRQLNGFMAYAMKSDGFLYYALGKHYWREPIDSIYNPDSPVVQHGQLSQRGKNGAMPSIRLEMFRDGLEDYEYLLRADRLSAKLQNQGGVPPQLQEQAEAVRPYFKPGNSLFHGFHDFSRDAHALHEVRHKLGVFIERAESYLR